VAATLQGGPYTVLVPMGNSSALHGLAVRGLETQEQEEERKVLGMEANPNSSREAADRPQAKAQVCHLEMTYLP